MRNRDDTLWLKLRKQGADLAIHKTERLSEILSDADGKPSMFLFIGGTTKRAVLRTLTTTCPATNGQDGIHLRIDPKTWQSSRPLLFAEGPPATHLVLAQEGDIGDVIEWLAGDLTKALQAVYARLLSPFVDVVCLFLSDFSGVSEIVDFISTWLRNASNSSSWVRPRLAIVAAESDLKADWKRNFFRMLSRKTEIPFHTVFSGLAVHLLPSADLSDTLRHQRLRDFLLVESDIVRSCRIKKRMHFHASHIAALFDDAYSRLLSNTSFSYIVASRTPNPIPPGAARQVAIFLKEFRDPVILKTFALPVVASAFMLDAFPPEMHEFNPLDVYHALYQQIWRQAAKALHLEAESVRRLEDVVANRYQSGKLSLGKEAHSQVMLSFCDRWRLHRSNATCLMCLLRRPEYGLPCGHVFCEVDIRRFGKEVRKDKFTVSACFLCSENANGANFRLKPRTKGISILGIDGGGVRGIIPLQLLQLLELKLKPYLSEFPIQNHFDMTIGTSSGGLISLATVHQGISVSECIELFQQLSARAFKGRFGHSTSVFSKAWSFVVSLFKDSLYPSKDINGALKEQFGQDNTLLHYSAAAARDAKVAVTVTGVPNGEYVLTNYNGVGSKDFRHGYRHALPKDPSLSIKTWEAGRATTAAPWYFAPHLIHGVGVYQDGGLWRNNPLDVGISEARARWPHISKPDVTLSLGTGYRTDTNDLPSPCSPATPTDVVRDELRSSSPKRNFDRFVKRLLHSFLYSIVMDGEKFHIFSCQFNRETQDVKRAFRLNIELPSETPDLDDVGSMEMLRKETYKQYGEDRVLDDIAYALISALFYFELRTRPVRNRSHVSCLGVILCDIEPGPGLVQLIEELERHKSEFHVLGNVVPLLGSNLGDLGTDPFQIPVEISIRDLDSPFAISLHQGGRQRRNGCDISASPFKLRDLLQIQGWNCPFGRDDHGPNGPEDKKPRKRGCEENVTSRRTRIRL